MSKKSVRNWVIGKVARSALKDWLVSKGVPKVRATLVTSVLMAVLKKEMSR